MTDALGTASYDHDAVGRIKSATDSQGFKVGYTYDDAGNVETIKYPGDKVVTYGYDELNRLKTVKDWLQPPPHRHLHLRRRREAGLCGEL